MNQRPPPPLVLQPGLSNEHPLFISGSLGHNEALTWSLMMLFLVVGLGEEGERSDVREFKFKTVIIKSPLVTFRAVLRGRDFFFR